MPRRIVVLGAALIVLAAPLFAQTAATPRKGAPVKGADQTPPPPPTRPAAPAPPAPPTPPRRGQPINIKVDVVITDQRGSAAPVKKTLSVIVADQQNGMIRSDAIMMPGPGVAVGEIPLHVDAGPEILPDGKIRLRFGLSYDLPAEAGEASPATRVMRTSIRENVALILDNGKPLMVTQSADPVGDRQVMVEVKATVLK
jgi:hypothetical protein